MKGKGKRNKLEENGERKIEEKGRENKIKLQKIIKI